MPKRPSPEAERGLAQLLDDSRVDQRVKLLLQREYEPQTPLYGIFVDHSWLVTEASVAMAQAVGVDPLFVREAAWLHDIGIKYTHAPGIHCLGDQHYLRHGLIGQELCQELGLTKHGSVCLRHVGTGLTASEIERQGLPLPAQDMLNQTLEERLICYADQFFSKSRGGPCSVDDVRRRTSKFGPDPLQRFEALHSEFGQYFPA